MLNCLSRFCNCNMSYRTPTVLRCLTTSDCCQIHVLSWTTVCFVARTGNYTRWKVKFGIMKLVKLSHWFLLMSYAFLFVVITCSSILTDKPDMSSVCLTFHFFTLSASEIYNSLLPSSILIFLFSPSPNVTHP